MYPKSDHKQLLIRSDAVAFGLHMDFDAAQQLSEHDHQKPLFSDVSIMYI
jgi:hypothetical protein